MQGIGHLQKTSLPIGGKDTNSVLVGHTGITAKTFFDNLNKMKIKDTFYIYILDDVLEYEVKEIKTVLPDDTESIRIVEGEELVTLVTCTPKYINSHRLLVIGERIQEAKENDSKNVMNVAIEYTVYISIVVVVFIVFLIINKFMKIK